MASYRRFDAPFVKSISTPGTWNVHQAREDILGAGTEDGIGFSGGHSLPTLTADGRISKGLSGDEYGRLMSRLRRITPGTIRVGRLESPFVEHRSSFPTALSDPFAYGGAKSIPGGASAASLSPSATPAYSSASAVPASLSAREAEKAAFIAKFGRAPGPLEPGGGLGMSHLFGAPGTF